MPPLPQRHQAIDVMRGLTVVLMIVVNMSISETQSYAPLLHATWHGLTLTDLVFPSFLFVVGAAMSFSLGRYQAQGTPAFLRKVARRTVLIFGCGVLLYWFPFFTHDAAGALVLRPFETMRFPGVLQRIALGYGIAALVIHWGGVRGALGFAALALAGYWALLAAFGDYTLAGNAVLRLDRWLLGESHLYRGEGIPFDPEGVLSTLPAVVNVLAGWLAGEWVRRHGATDKTVAGLLLAAVGCTVVALAWQPLLPFNKKLWTSSYVLVTTGAALALLAVLIEVIDKRGWRGWTGFFEVFGRNTLFLYLMSELTMAVMWLTQIDGRDTMLWVYEHGFSTWAGDKPGSLVYALVFMLAWWAVGWVMDRRRIYIRL